MTVHYDLNNPLPYLQVCASYLDGNDEACYPKVTEAVRFIHTQRNAGNNSPALDAALISMANSVDVASQVVARYILQGGIANEVSFPFSVKNERGRVTAKRVYPLNPRLDHGEFAPAQAAKTAYIANIPVVFTENYQRNDATKNKVLDGLRDQTFGTTAAASRLKSPSRTAVIFGANRCKSIEKSKNAAFKNYVMGMDSQHEILSSTVGFLWEPKWVCGTRDVSVKQVRNYYDLLKRLDPELAELCRSLQENPVGGVNDRVPYEEIRETIKNSQKTVQMIQLFRQADQTRRVYLSILDPDFIRLNNDGRGLFSHYSRLIRSHTQTHGVPPAVATTGYRADSTVIPILRYGVLLDMRVREAVSRFLALASYFPEPNMIVLVPPQFYTVPESFINTASSSPQESRNLIAYLLQSRGISPAVALAFQSIGSVTTEMPDRFINPTISKMITHREIGQAGVLKSLSGISQSILKSMFGWGMSIEHAISVKGATSRGHTYKLFSVFNPIKLSTDSRFSCAGSSFFIPGYFLAVLDQYKVYANLMGRLTEFVCDHFNINDFFRQEGWNMVLDIDFIKFWSRPDVQEIIREAGQNPVIHHAAVVLKIQMEKFITHFNGLHALGITPVEFATLVEAIKLAGRTIHHTLRDIYEGRL